MRSDWTLFQRWSLVDLDWRRKPWVVASATALVAVFGMLVLPSFASIFRDSVLDDANAVRVALPAAPIETGTLPEKKTSD